MNRHDLNLKRLEQTLDQLENQVWGPSTLDSNLVSTCHRLRKKPIGEFSTEDLRIMIGQAIGTQFLVPLALERLAKDPLIEGDFYPGDLLSSILTLPNSFWPLHTKLHAQLEHILSQLTDPPEELAQTIDSYKANRQK